MTVWIDCVRESLDYVCLFKNEHSVLSIRFLRSTCSSLIFNPYKGTSRGVRLRFCWNWIMLKRIKKNEIRVFFLWVEKRFKGVKTTPKVCTQKSFFFSISRKKIIFFSKTNAKIFFITRQSRVQNCCFEGLHPLFFSNINIFF